MSRQVGAATAKMGGRLKKGKPLWLLLSDLHFKSYDLDRIVRTASWIASLPGSVSGPGGYAGARGVGAGRGAGAGGHTITRAVICGDLLTARTSQPTHVLSACYRFLNDLAAAVPHVNILLGNHDLAYRQDYQTSALEALAMTRLAPYVTLHADIGRHVWDGRRVLVMPFREDQGLLVDAVRELALEGEDGSHAAATIGFGHMAINRAITQRHIIDPKTGAAGLPSRYPGLTGAGGFAPLARTFTGHFHSHQTILQAAGREAGDLRGSITYVGAPLQLTWADLLDTQRGVVLLDPETLETELVQNPHAVGYVTVEAQDVFADQVPAAHVSDKHVMITGRLSRYKYILAREQLVKLGARSVRDWKAFQPEWQFGPNRLGKTMLSADVQNLPGRNRAGETGQEEAGHGGEGTALGLSESPAIELPGSRAEQIEHKPLDLSVIVDEYVSSLTLGATLEEKREVLAVVGKRLVDIGSRVRDKTNHTVKYRDMLDLTTPASLIPSNDAPHAATATNIFESQPVAVEITNFLGVQGTLRLDFERHFQPGLNFIVGHNGAGKSTVIEAIVWCQFGQCIREGLGVNDVVNDAAGKDCNVRLTFANGYAISRSRRHGEFQNRVFVERDGQPQPQFEGANARVTQASLNELLGVDFDTFIRTILLGNESTRSFLSASPLQKRQLTETALGLGILDGCAEACNAMLGQVDGELADKRSRLKEVTHTVGHLQGRVDQMEQTLERLRNEAASLSTEMQREERKHVASVNRKELRRKQLVKTLETEQRLPDLEPELLDLQNGVSQAKDEVGELDALEKLAQARLSIDREGSIVKQEIAATRTQIHHLEEALERLLAENSILEVPTSAVEEDDYYYSSKTQGERSSSGSSGQDFVLAISRAFRKLWIEVLKIVSPTARENFRRIAFQIAETKRLWREHTDAIDTLARSVDETHGKVAITKDRVANFPRDIARQHVISERDVHAALQTLPTVEQASAVPAQLAAAADALEALTQRHGSVQRESEARQQRLLRKQRELEAHERDLEATRRRWEVALDRYRLMLAGKEREAGTYGAHLAADAATLADLRTQAGGLEADAARTHGHREVFAFWQAAFTRRQVAAAKPTFRRHVIERHLGELNKLLGQILLVMYRDAHYARSTTTGTIGALFREEDDYDEDEEGGEDGDAVRDSGLGKREYDGPDGKKKSGDKGRNTNTNTKSKSKSKKASAAAAPSSSPKSTTKTTTTTTTTTSPSKSTSASSVLDPSLSINPALAYAKKSGGERKRVDLALFFALFMMGEARSAHMARYMLVDEAFDSLDEAGQASVLKWCRWMTGRLAYVFVITHSRNLVRLAEAVEESEKKGGEGEDDGEGGGGGGGGGANVVTVKAGDRGTELVV
ncbi:hypothetical protein SLS62_001248 [Diatrype stigma]|uniref:Rad50/SbcC-type AAA domain-containing protein n=1 Tax=Diatrype stigma TaxID=117547 RepID=A0AAN9VAY7_9PEZI